MRLLSYTVNDSPSFGALTPVGAVAPDAPGTGTATAIGVGASLAERDLGVIDLGARMRGVADLGDLIAQQRLEEAREVVAACGVSDLALSEVTFQRLLPSPGKIFCIGVNYGGRADEYADASQAGHPSVFVRFPESLVGHGQAIVRPLESEQLDYEGEIVIVIGTGGRRIRAADARGHIAGLTLGNEGTVRDWVRHGKFNVTQGKNFHHSGSIGPWLVTLDEIGDFAGLRITTRVNSELRQDDSPATMRFSIERLVEYLSTFIGLDPGDVVFTGTPTGAGARLDPPVWLSPGDVVEVSAPGIGTLRNHVIDEDAAAAG